MKLLRFQKEKGVPRIGFMFDNYIYDIKKLIDYSNTGLKNSFSNEMIDILDIDQSFFQQIKTAYRLIPELSDKLKELIQKNVCLRLEQVKVLLPFKPQAIICTGNNYRDHLNEKTAIDNRDQKGDNIEIFLKLPECVIGPYDDIKVTSELTEKLDYENELAVIIGREAWKIDEEDAKNCIFGYSVFNDLSARDRQLSPKGCYLLGLSKNFECSGIMGPYIVTADEFEYPPNLQLTTKVNGEVRQSTNTDHMINYPAYIISYFSRFFKLKPGYVLLTGTCGGTAWSTDPGLGGIPYERSDISRGGYLKAGDVVSCSIEGIGEIRNLVV